jgi:hypothetical protein
MKATRTGFMKPSRPQARPQCLAERLAIERQRSARHPLDAELERDPLRASPGGVRYRCGRRTAITLQPAPGTGPTASAIVNRRTLTFYRQPGDAIELIRVYHAARDVDEIDPT